MNNSYTRKTSNIRWNSDLNAFELSFKNPLNNKRSRAFIHEDDIIDLILAKDKLNTINVRQTLRRIDNIEKELTSHKDKSDKPKSKKTWKEEELV